MRLSGLALAAVLLSSSCLLAQHSSGGGGGTSGGSSSGGGSHSSGSSGSSYSGGGSSGSHSSGGAGHSSSGGSHSGGGGHSSGGGHVSASTLRSRSSASLGKNDRGTNLTKTGPSARLNSPQKRGFFSVLFHPFRRVQPKTEHKPALYLPKPICPHGRCAPPCPVGQVRSGGACATPIIFSCILGQFSSGHGCGYTRDHQCRFGQIWDGSACTIGAHLLDNCFAQRRDLQRQIQRVQAAESVRRSACANGPRQECSQATSTWQSEENLRQSLLGRYQQCQIHSSASYSARSDPYAYGPAAWLDTLRFDGVF